MNLLTVASCALHRGQNLPNNKYANCINFFYCRHSSNTREPNNLQKLFCVRHLHSLSLCRHATLLPTNGCWKLNHIPFRTFSQPDVCFDDARKVQGSLAPPITVLLLWVSHVGLTRRKSRNNIGSRRHTRSSVVLTVFKISVVIINDDQKPAIRLSDLLVFELISYRVHINQSNAKRIHQKKYVIKYTVQNITNLIHESRLKPWSRLFKSWIAPSTA